MTEDSGLDRRTPDPSTLTTAAILREIQNLDKILSARIETTDKTFNLSKDKIYETFKGVEEVSIIKHKGIQIQFEERDVRTLQASIAAKTAVDAALQAQKEAAGEQNRSLTLSINKSEEATQKQLEQQRIVLAAVEKTLGDKINDIAERMTRFEGLGAGKSAISAPLWGIIGSVVTGILVAGIITFVNNPTTSQDNLSITTRLDGIERLLVLNNNSNKKPADANPAN